MHERPPDFVVTVRARYLQRAPDIVVAMNTLSAARASSEPLSRPCAAGCRAANTGEADGVDAGPRKWCHREHAGHLNTRQYRAAQGFRELCTRPSRIVPPSIHVCPSDPGRRARPNFPTRPSGPDCSQPVPGR